MHGNDTALEAEFKSLCSAAAPDKGGGKYIHMHEHVKQSSQCFSLSAHSQDRCSLSQAV